MEARRRIFTSAGMAAAILLTPGSVREDISGRIRQACESGDARKVALATLERERREGDTPKIQVELANSCGAEILRQARRYIDDGATDSAYRSASDLNRAAEVVERTRVIAERD